MRAYIHFTHIQLVIIEKKKTQKINVDNYVEKLECLGIAGGNVYGSAAMEDGIVIPQKIKCRISL